MTTIPQATTVRLILGDQLNHDHSWFKVVDDSVLYCLMEVSSESAYVTHHIQKIVLIFSAMRQFAQHLEAQGHRVHYVGITDPDNTHQFEANLKTLFSATSAERFEYMEPDEYRLDVLLRSSVENLSITSSMVSAEHFYTTRDELSRFFTSKKQFLMESFYRMMRRKHNVLMEEDQPITGKWNYDHENRKKLPKGHSVPEPISFSRNVEEVISDISAAGLKTIGAIDPTDFIWPVTRAEALSCLAYFTDNLLPSFGKYQDALTEHSWSVYHSRISSSLNIKLISPREVIDSAISAWNEGKGETTIAQLEGFVRQILGWREYMRGIYWMQMPQYSDMNYFEHYRPLPDFFWTGETQMRCMSKAIRQSLEFSYAHHIQRLMVTGNFALMAGIDPDEVDRWYLGIYIDAFEWVEITNTRGMSQFADGGIVGSKPYVSSANYLHKMGDHCAQCKYNYKTKVGENACPFNSLYWHFLDLHRDKLERNPRMSMMYRVWDKQDDQAEILSQATHYLENIETL